MAGGYHAIYRNFLAGPDNYRVAGFYLFNGYVYFFTVAHNASCFGLQAHQGFNGLAGFAFGPHLYHFAQFNQGDNGGGGFKVDVPRVPKRNNS